MAHTVELQAADGHRFKACVATPAGAPRGGLVIVQEIFGVNAHIRAVAEGYAADGYLVVAPALFDRVERDVELGYTPAERDRGMALKKACADEPALLDLAAAAAFAQRAGRVGIVGYCWGGYLSWLAAGRLDGIAAAVPYYGGGMQGRADVVPRCPVLGHFGERDAHIPVEGIRAVAAAHAGTTTVHFYPADHAFNRDAGASYDAASAQLARSRTVAFLRGHVG